MYWAMVGSKDAPGPGLVTEQALDYILKHGIGGQKALAWGRVRDDWTSLEEVNSEFVCGIYGVVIHEAQEESMLWDDVGGPELGGHEVGGGRHDPNYVYCATWAQQARMTRRYVANDLDEHHVIIWPHVWESLTPERKVTIAADYQALTGRPFPAIPSQGGTMDFAIVPGSTRPTGTFVLVGNHQVQPLLGTQPVGPDNTPATKFLSGTTWAVYLGPVPVKIGADRPLCYLVQPPEIVSPCWVGATGGTFTPALGPSPDAAAHIAAALKDLGDAETNLKEIS
jgi:hypothetical protein